MEGQLTPRAPKPSGCLGQEGFEPQILDFARFIILAFCLPLLSRKNSVAPFWTRFRQHLDTFCTTALMRQHYSTGPVIKQPVATLVSTQAFLKLTTNLGSTRTSWQHAGGSLPQIQRSHLRPLLALPHPRAALQLSSRAPGRLKEAVGGK